jgi:hypothetical protein
MAVGITNSKVSRAAALATIGWYLLLPPITHDGAVRAEARLADWLNIGAYESSGDCEAARLRILDDPRPLHDKDHPSLRKQILDSVCIASDDPRLKEK